MGKHLILPVADGRFLQETTSDKDLIAKMWRHWNRCEPPQELLVDRATESTPQFYFLYWDVLSACYTAFRNSMHEALTVVADFAGRPNYKNGDTDYYAFALKGDEQNIEPSQYMPLPMWMVERFFSHGNSPAWKALQAAVDGFNSQDQLLQNNQKLELSLGLYHDQASLIVTVVPR